MVYKQDCWSQPVNYCHSTLEVIDPLQKPDYETTVYQQFVVDFINDFVAMVMDE